MRFRREALLFAALALAGAAPLPASAAAPLQVAGWIPYWAADAGVADASDHLAALDTLYPFSYSVDKDGKPQDLADMGDTAWRRLIRGAKAKGVAVIPTLMWSDTANIDRILSSAKLRAAHVKAVAALVKQKGYDGIDIDYEGKLAKDKDAYSAFLKDLKTALGSRILSCTIEPRTPPQDLYASVPATLSYANDYAAINKYCDRVNLMTYDQQRADLTLNAAKKGAPYYPVADPDWVKAVVTLAKKDIDPAKLYVGIPTYGREVALTVSPDWFQAYKQISSVSDGYARDTAEEKGLTPFRNAAGELSYSYAPTSSTNRLLSSVSLSTGSAPKDTVAAEALAYATKTGKTVVVNLVWWSDAEAVAGKVALAKSLGVAGVSLFKIDGKEDEVLWDAL